MQTDRAIQSVPPGQVVPITTSEDLAALVRQCRSQGRAICDYGVGCRGLGAAPPADHVQIDPARGVIRHERADLMVQVHAATPLSQLAAALADSGQFFPLDGLDGRQTVGEAVAHHLYGPLRLSHGTMRDLLLGLTFVDGVGRIVHAGGRTVKNVAGYDLTRLMVGSMNMLGLLSELTLRTAAAPPCITHVPLNDFDLCLLDRHANALLSGTGSPWYLDWQGTIGGARVLHVGFAGTTVSRHAHGRGLIDWLKQIGYRESASDRDELSLSQDEAGRADRRRWRWSAGALVKLIVQPGRTGGLIGRLGAFCPPASRVDVLPIHGIIHIGGDWSVRQAEQVHQHVSGLGVMWQWLRRPGDDPMIEPIGPPQPDWSMLAAIKRAMDPDGVLNPGRAPWGDAAGESGQTTA